MKKITIVTILLFGHLALSQVGIGNTDPKAILDISSSNVATPTSTDGILIPRVDDFPLTNPTLDQDGMMVFATGNGTPTKGFYYWDNATSNWINIKGVEKIDDLLDGKSDNDGSNDGSSIFLGINAGANDNGTSNRNLGIGFQSLESNVNGVDNIALGYQSLRFNTNGQNNIALGYQSLLSNTTGNSNIAMGSYALNSNTLGTNNIAIGLQSLNLNTLGAQNITLGNNTMVDNIDGIGNIAIGQSALNSNIDGNLNIAIGHSTLDSNTSGENNSALGSFALNKNTTGSSNSAFGRNALNSNISGDFNTAIGSATLVFNTSGYYNTALGYSSLLSNSTGTNNVAIGYSALRSTTTGIHNIALGTNALFDNLSGSYNIAIGQFAGRLTTGNGSIFIGHSAGFNNTQNNRLFIENSSNDSNNALIYGEFDNNILRTNSEFQIGNPSLTGYAFPIADGTANQIMATDGIGQLSFVDASSISDTDWLTNTNSVPNALSDLIYHNGNTGIGGLASNEKLKIFGTNNTNHYAASIENGNGANGLTINIVGNKTSPTGTLTSLLLRQESTSTSPNNKFGIYNSLHGGGPGSGTGIRNWITNTATYSDEATGVENDIYCNTASSSYGTRNYVDGSGSGPKYGTHNSINGIAGGTHYGVYSQVSKAGSYAGYFLGNVSIGTSNANNYILPTIRGSNGQMMQTDAAGNVSWTNPEWTDGGTFIYPTDGTLKDVVIGQNTSGNGRLTIDGGTKAAAIATNKSGNFPSLHYAVDNYISNSGNGFSIAVDNRIEGTGNGNHWGTQNNLLGTGSGLKYGTYNSISSTAGGTHYGTYNNVTIANGWAGYFVGKAFISNKLGIGTGADIPDGFLDIRANNTGAEPNINLVDIGNTGARINFTNTATTGGNVWTLYGDSDNVASNSVFNIFHTSTGNVLRITGDGRVGIMRNPATNALEVNGEASKSVAGAFIANSDGRLKKNINTINSSTALERLLKLRGVSYEWSDDKTGTERPKGIQYGFIAQELMEVFPEKVTKDNLGYYQTAYGDYDAFFVQAVKELNIKVETLEAENSKLKAQLANYETLESRLTALENANKKDNTIMIASKN